MRRKLQEQAIITVAAGKFRNAEEKYSCGCCFVGKVAATLLGETGRGGGMPLDTSGDIGKRANLTATIRVCRLNLHPRRTRFATPGAGTPVHGVGKEERLRGSAPS